MKKLLFTIALACIGLTATSQVIRRSWSGEMEVMGQKLEECVDKDEVVEAMNWRHNKDRALLDSGNKREDKE